MAQYGLHRISDGRLTVDMPALSLSMLPAWDAATLLPVDEGPTPLAISNLSSASMASPTRSTSAGWLPPPTASLSCPVPRLAHAAASYAPI